MKKEKPPVTYDTRYRYKLDMLEPGTIMLKWVGIFLLIGLALAIPLGSSLLGSIAEGLAAGFLNTETATAAELYFDNEASLVLGLMFLLGSLLCRYGAEQKEA